MSSFLISNQYTDKNDRRLPRRSRNPIARRRAPLVGLTSTMEVRPETLCLNVVMTASRGLN
jgi:hypothetical protein